MYDYLIMDYISKMNVEDILNYAKKKNIPLSENDAIILHSYAKKYYKIFLYQDPTNILKEIKDKINPLTYKELYKLYIEYKIKYLNKK